MDYKEGAFVRDAGGKDYKNLAPPSLSEKRLSTQAGMALPVNVANPVFGTEGQLSILDCKLLNLSF